MKNLRSDIKKILADYKYCIFKGYPNKLIWVLDLPNYYYPVATWYKKWVHNEFNFEIECKDLEIRIENPPHFFYRPNHE